MKKKTPPNTKLSKSSSEAYESLLDDITQFGKKSGLKKVRVRLDGLEAEVEFQTEGNIQRPAHAVPSQRSAPPSATTSQDEPENPLQNYESNPKFKIIKSPLVGTFYGAPSPGAKPFITVGDQVDKGTTLAIIEAMKLMNELESDYRGTVEKILIDNGTPVEFDQPLIILAV
jgi:acetyl-CoA carboxylase biotin carboxyl carrier protein